MEETLKVLFGKKYCVNNTKNLKKLEELGFKKSKEFIFSEDDGFIYFVDGFLTTQLNDDMRKKFNKEFKSFESIAIDISDDKIKPVSEIDKDKYIKKAKEVFSEMFDEIASSKEFNISNLSNKEVLGLALLSFMSPKQGATIENLHSETGISILDVPTQKDYDALNNALREKISPFFDETMRGLDLSWTLDSDNLAVSLLSSKIDTTKIVKVLNAKLEDIKEIDKNYGNGLNIFSSDFKVGNNEYYVKHLKKYFGDVVAETFSNYFTQELGGDLTSFTPKDELNKITIMAIDHVNMNNDEYLRDCISHQLLKNELRNDGKQLQKVKNPSGYITMSNLDNVYSQIILNDDGKYVDFDGDEHSCESEYLNGNILLTRSEYDKFFESHTKVAYPKYWKEISEDRYFDMLSVLPPKNHKKINQIEFFQISEMQISNITNTFASLNDKYYESFQKTSVNFEDLSSNLKKFHLSLEDKESKASSLVDSSPSIDECIQQIEEEEAAKQNVKSPSL